jgi:DNA-binding response OmpR family regulator
VHPGPGNESQGKEGCLNILILDSDSRLGEALALALRQRAQVDWVTRGKAGLLLAEEKKADFVIVHAHISDISPTDFLRLLRLLRPRVRFAIFSADRPPEGLLEAKGDVSFPQPVHLKRLLRWIEWCLDQPSSCEAGGRNDIAASSR